MTAAMERPRITLDVPENVRRALYICAARLSISVGDVVEKLATGDIEDLSEDIAIADRAIEQGSPPPGSKRGRRPKSKD